MRRYLSVLALVAVLGLVAAACGGDDGGGTGATGATTATGASGELQPGGTVELAMLGDVSAAFDPQKEYYSVTWEWYRCCLLRTLLSYNGRTTAEGGADLLPDIASELPESLVGRPDLHVHAEERRGVRGSVRRRQVTSGDIVRALERDGRPRRVGGRLQLLLQRDHGFADFGAGKADAIKGLETPDDSTLVITLSEPAGYLPYLFAMAGIGSDPADERRAARCGRGAHEGLRPLPRGHRGRTSSWVRRTWTSRCRPTSRRRSRATSPGKSIQLVRNPNYDPATDGASPRLPGRVQHLDRRRQQRPVQQGRRPASWTAWSTASCRRRAAAVLDRPDAADRCCTSTRRTRFGTSRSTSRQPPFDDIHIRKAVNLALDKAGMRTFRGGSPSARSRVTSW